MQLIINQIKILLSFVRRVFHDTFNFLGRYILHPRANFLLSRNLERLLAQAAKKMAPRDVRPWGDNR